MDTFKEYLVKKEFTTKDYVIIATMFTAIAILGVIALKFFFGFPIFVVVLLLFCAGYAVSNMHKEYEYVLTNAEIDIDIISGQRHRKRMANFNLVNLELCANVNNPEHSGRLSGSFQETVVAEVSPRSPYTYFAIFSKDGKRTLLRFEPPLLMLQEMQKIVKSKVIITDTRPIE